MNIHAACAATALGLGALLAWRRRAVSPRTTAVVTALVAAVLALGVVATPRLPDEGLLVLHEGHAHALAQALDGRPIHTGKLYLEAWMPLGAWWWGPPSPRHILGWSLMASGVSWLLAWPLLRRLAADAVGPTVIVGWCALSTLGLSAATGDSEAPWVWLGLAVAGHGALAIHDARDRTDVALGGALAAAATACAAIVRIETAALALALLVGALAVRVPALRRIEDAWAARMRTPHRSLRDAVVVFAGIVAVLCAMRLVAVLLPPGGRTTWAAQALTQPSDAWWLGPWLHLAIAPPLLVMLTAVGVVGGIARPLTTGGWAIALPVGFTAYLSAGHGPPQMAAEGLSLSEMLRYAMLLQPVTWALAAIGWRAARAVLGARALLVLALVPPLPEVLAPFPSVETRTATELPFGRMLSRIDRDPQRLFRALIRATREHPTCTVVSWSRAWGPPGALVEAAVVFMPRRGGWQGRFPASRPEAEQAVADAGCGLWLRSDDCDLSRADACAAWQPSSPPLWTETWRGRPYRHPDHLRGPILDEVTVGLWTWP